MKNAAIPRLTAILILLNLGVAAFLVFRLFPGRRISPTFNTIPLISSQELRSEAISIRFSPDSKLLLIAGAIGKGRLGQYQNGDHLFSFKKQNTRLRLFDVARNREIKRLNTKPIFGGWNGDHMDLMPDFRTMITAGHFTEIKAINIQGTRPDIFIEREGGALTSVDVSPNGKTLALGTMSGVQFHDVKTFHLLKYYKHYGGNFGAEVRFGRNSDIVRVKWERSRNPHYVNAKTGKRIRFSHSTREFDVTFSPGGKYFAEKIGENQVTVWQHGTKRSFKIGTIKSTLIQIRAMQFSPDNKTLAVGGMSSTENPVRFYKLADIRKENTS